MKKLSKIFTIIFLLGIVTFGLTSCNLLSMGTTFSVTFETNGGNEIEKIYVTSGNTFDVDEPVKIGYSFDGWYLSNEYLNNEEVIMGQTPITSTIVLYAKWIDAVSLVTFETNGGSEINSVYVKYNDVLSVKEPTKEGYSFGGWYLDEKYSNQFFVEKDPIINDLTLYAKWNPNQLIVSFNSNGGSEIADVNVYYNESLNLTVEPTKTDFEFGGWYLDEECQTKYNMDSKVTTNLLLYAKWNKTIFDITFVTNCNQSIDKQVVTKNNLVVKPNDVEKDGYAFLGWYLDETFEIEYDFNQVVNSDLTLYARFDEIYEENDLIFTPKKDGTYMVKALNQSLNGVVIIPNTINGHIVNEIEALGFSGCSNITSIIIENNIEKIGLHAFKGCKNVESLSVPYMISSSSILFDVAPNSLQSVSLTNIADGMLPDVLTNYAFVREIKLSGSFTTIPSGIFTFFTNLESLSLPFIGLSKSSDGGFFGSIFGAQLYFQQGSTVPTTLKHIELTEETHIGQYAFYGLSYVETINLLSVEEIDQYAFENCLSLHTISLGNNLKVINSYAFYLCLGLTNLVLPDSVTHIYYSAFMYTSLTELYIPLSIEVFEYHNDITTLQKFVVKDEHQKYSVVDGILYNKDQTELVSYPAGINNSSLKVLDSVKVIGEYAFQSVRNLKTIEFNEGLEEIRAVAFRNTGLTSVTLPTTIKYLGTSAFSTNYSLTSFNFPATLSHSEGLSLNNFVLSSCNKLTTLTVPSYITSIPQYFVSGCSNLQEMKILGEMVLIDDLAFSSTNISEISITFADNAYIGERIFNNCSVLTKFNIYFIENITTYPQLEAETGFGSFVPQIICENETIKNGLSEMWPDYASFITCKPQAIVYSIDENGILTNVSMDGTDTNIIIPEGVKGIAYNAIYNNKLVTSVYIPASVTRIDEKAIYSCSNLLSIEFGHTGSDFEFTTLNYKGTTGNARNTINCYPVVICQDKEALTIISKTFSHLKTMCYLVDKVVIEDNIIYNSTKDTILRVKGVESFTLSDNINTIGAYAFNGNNNLTSIDFGENLTIIETYAFGGCHSLEEVEFPASLEEIGDSAFSGLEGLTTITFNDSSVHIGESAFSDCYEVCSLTLGANLLSIGYGAFTYLGDSNGIESIIIPSTIENIGESAFEDANIETIYCCFGEDHCENFDDGTVWMETFYYDIVFDYEG